MAKNIDEYIRNLYRRYIESILAMYLALFLFALILGYYIANLGFPKTIYFVVVIPILLLIWELARIRKRTGEKLWNILCPTCDEYIPLHHFECPPPCGKEYKDRSIIEGCPECKTRYKKEGHDAFRHAICDNCGNTLDFSDPYDFKAWSVLSKGETWETETLLVKNDTVFSSSGKEMIVGGLLIIILFRLLSFSPDFAMDLGIYFASLGLIFLIIHKFLYGDKKRVPNPTFKRKEEPETLYAFNDSLVWRSVLLAGVVLLFVSFALIYIMIIQMFFLHDTAKANSYTPFDIGWRVAIFVAAIVLIVAHSLGNKEYKKVPYPGSKEGSS